MLVLILIIAVGVMLGMGGHRRLNVQHRDPAKQEAKEAFEHKARINIMIVVAIIVGLASLHHLLS